MGVEVKTIVAGTGDMPPKGAMVEVQYTGTFTNGTKFDSSLDRPGQKPFRFQLGAGQGNLLPTATSPKLHLTMRFPAA